MAKSLPVTHHLNLKREEICKFFILIIGSVFYSAFRPVKYDRKLMEDTVDAVKRVTEIRKKREGSYSIRSHTHYQRFPIVVNVLWNESRTRISPLYLEQIGKIKGSSAPCWFMGSWHESQSGSGTSSSRWETQRFVSTQVFTNNNSYRNHNLSCKEAVWNNLLK